ncbi:hypothetical protein SRABI106_03879 [Rahnella aquatilis]|nr:hypothetical protein SRABI106_03879 [Rahnella aquatilis]
MVTAERRHFDDFRPKHHVSQTKTTTNQTAVTEQFAYLIRRCVGGDVEIFWFFIQQQITHTAADQEGFKARLVQAVQDFQGVFADITTRNIVLIAGNNGHRTGFTGVIE